MPIGNTSASSLLGDKVGECLSISLILTPVFLLVYSLSVSVPSSATIRSSAPVSLIIFIYLINLL